MYIPGYMKLLIVLAVLPGILLMRYIYKLDVIEKEPKGLIVKLFIGGALSTITALILELAGGMILDVIFKSDTLLYLILENFIVVACAEEAGKYAVLKQLTWTNREFNYLFDGVVYAVAVGLGFAILENVEYAFSYGLATTIVRALTAVPAHTIFAIFMGHFYGCAKRAELQGRANHSKVDRKWALIIPILLHGFYDFAASGELDLSFVIFLVFIVLLDVIAFRSVRRYAREDQSL